ncbi:MAG: Unknown protein [uncultured Aureispira sp.]|uniref:Uncharacterized protein n=1 Tax=uncultured Aureispira sp. TaxID=1331704 RepID=A0A6S6TQZ1_9BACT|nr:MAG: Unknown protein [uncultured Aureispira sp.]
MNCWSISAAKLLLPQLVLGRAINEKVNSSPLGKLFVIMFIVLKNVCMLVYSKLEKRKNMLFLKLTLGLLLITTSYCLGQTRTENLEKYWHYKERLIGTENEFGFLDIGIGRGMSLAASERYPSANCTTDYYLKKKGCTGSKGRGRMHWGDASLYHGLYMAILALEYANLEQAQQSTDAVAEELWYALEAFERLDSMAEVVLGLPGKKDGFFIRDDIEGDFYIKKGAARNRRFTNGKDSYSCLSSALSCGPPSAESGAFISQDQVIGLFVGFSMIQQLIPDKRYKTNGPTFGEKARLNVHRITSHMMDRKWKLRTPDGSPIPDKWGGNAIGLSFPISTIANQLTEQKYVKTYQKNGAILLGKPIYDLLQGTLSVQHPTNVVLALASATLLPERSYKELGRRSIKHDVIIYPLMRAVLFNQKIFEKIKRSDFEAILNTAPYDGPCFGLEDCTAPDGWKSYNRWIHPHFKNGNPYGVHSEMPGLDYLLLYNLYHYYYKANLPSYKKTSK